MTKFAEWASGSVEQQTFASLVANLFWHQLLNCMAGPVAEWLACWTQAQKGPGSYRSRDAVG